MECVTIVAVLALWEYTFFTFKAGLSRQKFGVKVPATSGSLEWEKLYRVQCNTLEQLIIFIPSLYAFAHFLSPTWATGIGSVFLVGRVLFYLGYTSETPNKRFPGFLMTFFPSQILLLGSFVGAIIRLTQ